MLTGKSNCSEQKRSDAKAKLYDAHEHKRTAHKTLTALYTRELYGRGLPNVLSVGGPTVGHWREAL